MPTCRQKVERATDAEGTLQENIDAEAQARQDADGLLQQGIDDEAQRAKDAEEANAGEIEGIKALIPSTASEANKLADTNYVNSSIQTATAEYRGDYNVVTRLPSGHRRYARADRDAAAYRHRRRPTRTTTAML